MAVGEGGRIAEAVGAYDGIAGGVARLRRRDRLGAQRERRAAVYDGRTDLAEPAIQASIIALSRGHGTRPLDCFVARAPRNDSQ
jgi:hypothetical protein